jgi:thioredoxin 1
LGYLTKCRSGSCPTSGRRLSGVILGALLGAMVAFAWLHRGGGGGEDLLGRLPQVATIEQFDAQVAKAPAPVLVDFFATWCGPCRDLEPTIASLEANYRGRVAFVRVDVDAASAVARAQGIEAMPTIIVFRDGNRSAPPFVGVRPEEDYRMALDRALETPRK